MRKIDRNVLENWCATAEWAVESLGKNLSRWMLRPELVEKVGLPRPRLPDRLGTTAAIFVLDRGPDTVAEAFLLPLEWRSGVADSPRLPAGVSEVASSARGVLEHAGWGLDLAEEAGRVDLSALEVGADSAWAPLAAALEVAVNGGRPVPSVLATGRWSEGGLGSVGHVEQKVRAAIATGATQLFVPGADLERARAAAGRAIEVRAYPVGEPAWRRALSEHLRELHSPPRRGESDLATRTGYANLAYVSGNHVFRQRYYFGELLDEIAGNVGKPFAAPRIRKLAIALSFNHEVCLMLLKALHPLEPPLILHSADTAKHLAAIKTGFGPIEPLLLGDDRDTLANCARWLAASGPSAVEITGGTKAMTALLIEAGKRSGSAILYLDHGFRERIPLYGTESLRRLDWLEAPRGD